LSDPLTDLSAGVVNGVQELSERREGAHLRWYVTDRVRTGQSNPPPVARGNEADKKRVWEKSQTPSRSASNCFRLWPDSVNRGVRLRPRRLCYFMTLAAYPSLGLFFLKLGRKTLFYNIFREQQRYKHYI